MNVVSEAGAKAADQLDTLLDRLMAPLRSRAPDVVCRVHHGANDTSIGG